MFRLGTVDRRTKLLVSWRKWRECQQKVSDFWRWQSLSQMFLTIFCSLWRSVSKTLTTRPSTLKTVDLPYLLPTFFVGSNPRNLGKVALAVVPSCPYPPPMDVFVKGRL